MYWFTTSWWKYLLAKKNPLVSWPTVLGCRMKGHPKGIIFFNAGGLEPDDRCQTCLDRIG